MASSSLCDDEVRSWFDREIPAVDSSGKRVLVVVPDATRTAPLPLLFGALYDKLEPVAACVDVLVALGTHPPMSESDICRMLGINDQQRSGRFANVGLFNHEWDQPARLLQIGLLSKA